MTEVTYGTLWKTYVGLFQDALKRGHVETATNILDSALTDAEDIGEIDPVLIWSVHSLSGLYCSQGNHTAASRLLRRGLELKEKLLGLNHPDVVDSLEKLALSQLSA